MRFLVIFLSCILALPIAFAVAELPRVYVDTTMPVQTGVVWNVSNNCAGIGNCTTNLQTALNNAQPGDTIKIANGATFTGTFILPNKNTASAKWILIRPMDISQLPPEGTRMTPATAAAANLPTILAPSNAAGLAAFQTAVFAHHYRLIGLNVSVTTSAGNETYQLVCLGGNECTGNTPPTALNQIPYDIVLDRMYIHGTTVNQVRRCVILNSATSAVIDSYLSDCHSNGGDSQAITGFFGPGPFKINNNYLEGAAENLAFGGSDPIILNLTPSDIEIRYNYFFKPASWEGGVWLEKNLLELKNAQRVLIEGNVFEHTWVNGQGGMPIVFKSVNQNCGAPWSVTQDVTFQNNILRNVAGGFAIAGRPDTCQIVDVPARRMTITNNLIFNISLGTFTGDGDGFQFHDDPADVYVAHNTIVTPIRYTFSFGGPGPIYPGPGPPIRVNIINNIGDGASGYALVGRDVPFGSGAVTTYMPDGSFLGNVVSMASSSGYPSQNYYPATLNAIGFVNPSSYDFHLAANSPYKGKGTDGLDPGADIDAITAATAGVLTGTPTVVAVQPPPTVLSGAPLGILPSNTVSTTLNATTSNNSVCHYSNISNTAYVNGTVFATTGSTSHSTPLFGLLSNTTYNYYVRCADAMNTSIISTNDYLISFSVNGSGSPVPLPPVVTNGTPNGTLPSGTTSATLNVTTNNNSVCHYSNISNTLYGSSTPFVTTGTMLHSTPLSSLLDNTTYNYYVRCADATNTSVVSTTDYLVNFSVNSSVSLVVPPPVLSNGVPNATLSPGTINTTLNVTTNNNAICHYSNNSNTAYAGGTVFTTTGTTVHSTLLLGLQDNHTYNYYVRCADAINNSVVDTSDYTVTFAVGVLLPPNVADVNQDYTVNMADMLLVLNDLGKTAGFNPRSDINVDGKVNLYDLVLVGQNWGRSS